MTEKEYEARLDIFRHQIDRLIEIDECRTARERTLRTEVESLKLQAANLAKQIFFLRLEKQ